MATSFVEFCETHRVPQAFAEQLRDVVLVLDVSDPVAPRVVFPAEWTAAKRTTTTSSSSYSVITTTEQQQQQQAGGAEEWLESLEPAEERDEVLAAIAAGREAFVRTTAAARLQDSSVILADSGKATSAPAAALPLLLRPLPSALDGQRFVVLCRTPVTDQYITERRANPSQSRLRLCIPSYDNNSEEEAAETHHHRRNHSSSSVPRELRVYAPNGAPIPIDTELFQGHLLVRTREATPDAYFTSVRRRLEVQLQGRFKSHPSGMVYMGGEIPRPLALSRYTQFMCSVLVKFLQRFNRKVHVSFGTAEERAHIVFPIFEVMDRVVLTPLGETPPALGSALPESREKGSGGKRRSSEGSDISLDHVYTMAFWNMFTDFETWKVVNVPGVRAVDLHTFWRDMAFHLIAYAAPADKPHTVANRHMIASVEVVHDSLPAWPEAGDNPTTHHHQTLTPRKDENPEEGEEGEDGGAGAAEEEEDDEEAEAVVDTDSYEPLADDSTTAENLRQ